MLEFKLIVPRALRGVEYTAAQSQRNRSALALMKNMDVALMRAVQVMAR